MIRRASGGGLLAAHVQVLGLGDHSLYALCMTVRFPQTEYAVWISRAQLVVNPWRPQRRQEHDLLIAEVPDKPKRNKG